MVDSSVNEHSPFLMPKVAQDPTMTKKRGYATAAFTVVLSMSLLTTFSAVQYYITSGDDDVAGDTGVGAGAGDVRASVISSDTFEKSSMTDRTVFNSHSIYGRQKGDDKSTYSDTIDLYGRDKYGNERISWQSLVECFPDTRLDKNRKYQVNNYKNWACDDIYNNDWKNTDFFPCGKDEANPYYYFLQDLTGKTNNDGSWSIKCWYEYKPEADTTFRNLEFPAGYFAQDEQVWVPPNTAIFNAKADPNGSQNDNKQTYFIAMVDGDTYSSYKDFRANLGHPDSLVNGDVNTNDIKGYCYPPDNYDPYEWSGTDKNGKTWYNVKKYRIGFLMHGNSYIGAINILGSDVIRPHESNSLCGGGAIETPGCISQFGSLGNDDGGWGCYPDDGGTGIDTSYNYANNNNYDDWWVTGGVINWKVEEDNFGGISGINVNNVRFNDPEARGLNYDNIRYAPASQVSFYLPGTPDGSYTHDVTLTSLVSATTVADGLNLAGKAYTVHISDSSMQNTGDDAYGFWQGYGDQKYITLIDSSVYHPGIRQKTQNNVEPGWGFGSCISFFGCHIATIKNFKCYDRRCDGNDECTETAQGHLMTFYPKSWFVGKYNWDDMPHGVCEVDATNLNWYYENTEDSVNENDSLSNGRTRRKWISIDHDADWGDDVEPLVGWDNNGDGVLNWNYPRDWGQ